MAKKWSKEDLAVSFAGIEDPRVARTRKYPLEEVLFLVLIGALMGVESWRGIELTGKELADLLRRFFPYDNGIPSHQTIGRVFSLIKPQSFESFFASFAAQLHGPCEGKQIALDGKTLRGSFDAASGQKALHLLHACAVQNGLSLAQFGVDEKSNEITAVPEVLKQLDIKGAMISVDALNTQKSIAAQIVDAKADYTLALKGNHKSLNDEVNFIFDTGRYDEQIQTREVTEKGHGRITEWRYQLLALPEGILPETEEWKGLKAIGRSTTKTLRNGKESIETRNYLLSYADVAIFRDASRGHWGIENKLHWSLDVIFNEDQSRKRKDHAPRNFAVIRKLALNILRTHKGKSSVPLMRHRLALNKAFLIDILTQSGFKTTIA